MFEAALSCKTCNILLSLLAARMELGGELANRDVAAGLEVPLPVHELQSRQCAVFLSEHDRLIPAPTTESDRNSLKYTNFPCLILHDFCSLKSRDWWRGHQWMRPAGADITLLQSYRVELNLEERRSSNLIASFSTPYHPVLYYCIVDWAMYSCSKDMHSHSDECTLPTITYRYYYNITDYI